VSTHVKRYAFERNTDIFTRIMSRRNIYTIVGIIAVLFSTWFFLGSGEDKSFSENVKVILRDVGHQLLLSNKDSTSLVLPVIEVDRSKYRILFQNKLAIEPGNLVSIIQKNFKKTSLSSNYLVEVINCTTHEVAYSYKMKNTKENNIISCIGRVLEENCYTIEISFKDHKTIESNQTVLYVLAIIAFMILLFIFYRRRKVPHIEKSNDQHTDLGKFKFYPEQNKLVKEAVEISLSKKECELLSIFIAKPNQIIKREELMKRVWEDNGVIVGRSLDTYISKLRKKLKDDASIKISNVHGVGYKLEVD